MVQRGDAGAADVHAGSEADSLEAFKNLDLVGVVGTLDGGLNSVVGLIEIGGEVTVA